jgi:hypothetical protein
VLASLGVTHLERTAVRISLGQASKHLTPRLHLTPDINGFRTW